MHAIVDRWQGLDARERRWIVAGAVVVIAALAYAFAWLPLASDAPRAARDAGRSEARLAGARDAAAIAGARAVVPSREPIDAAIPGALARYGIAPGDATLEIVGARASLTLPSVRFATLVALVDALARERAVHVVDATVTARVEPGRVRAELTLAR